MVRNQAEMEKIKVSILVPVYNVEKYIARCAQTLFTQTYPNIEYIIVDDCSTDGSVEELRHVLTRYPSLQKQVSILSHTKNQGLAASRLTALRQATGDYVLNVDSDDYIATNMVELLVNSAIKNNADIVICDFMHVYPNGTEFHKQVDPPSTPHKCMEAVLNGTMHAAVCNKLIRRTLYTDNQIYPTQGIDMREDLSVTYRLFYFANTISYVNKPLYYYRLSRPGSYINLSYTLKAQDATYMLLEQMQKFQKCTPVTKNILRAFQYFYAATLTGFALNGNLKLLASKKTFYKSIKLQNIITHPSLPVHYKIAGSLYLLKCKPLLLLFRKLTRLLKRL